MTRQAVHKEVAGFAKKEIENVQDTKNPSSWNDTFDGNKERWRSTKTKNDFLFQPSGEKSSRQVYEGP